MNEEPTEKLDLASPTANMYGCEPCPQCKSKYRAPHPSGYIECDACGYRVKFVTE